MNIEFNHKDKNMLYCMMKIITNYDCRWLNGNIAKCGEVNLKRTSEKIYNSRKSILKYYNVQFEEKTENLNNESKKDI